jgi:hypothetical protein
MKIGEPLWFATMPEDYESLIGLTARATADHVLLDLNRVLRRAGISMDRPGYLSRLEPEALARLASVLGCPTEEVISRATPALMPDAKNSAVALGTVVLNASDIETARRRISPLAIANGSHHRESWLLRILPYCPASYELLRSDCSECGAALRWKKSVGIGVCETCEQVVAPADAPTLELALREDYTLFSRLLSTRTLVRETALTELSADVRHIDGETLIRMVIGIGACVHLASRFVNRKAIYKLPPAILAAIISTGTGMLREWPDRLQNWARAEASNLVANGATFQKLRARLQRLGHRTRVSSAQATLVRDALPDIFGNVQRSFRPPSDTILRCEAQAILGLGPRLLELVDARLLDAEELNAGPNRPIRFSRTAVTDLRGRIDGSISIPTLARATGLPIYAIENLCDHGLLDPEKDPALQYLRHASSISSGSIDRLGASILGRKGAGHPADVVALGTAARRIGGRLKPWTDIFMALADGSLGHWVDPKANGDVPWLRRILVQPSTLARFDEVRISSAAGSNYLAPADCSLTDAKEILNLHGTVSINLQHVFSEEIAAHQQRGTKKALSMKAVLARAQAEISVAEVCARAGWNPRQARWALRPFEQHRTDCGWYRRLIEVSGVLGERIDWETRAYRREPRVFS